MELFDKLKARLRENFGGKSPASAPASGAASVAPGGIQLKPNVEGGVAGLSKNLILGLAAVLGLAVLAVWFGLSHVKPTMRTDGGSAQVALANKNNIASPKTYQPPKPAAVASTPNAVASSAATAAQQPPAAQQQANPQQSPQQQALAQALSGNGSGGGGWSPGGQKTSARTDNRAHTAVALAPGIPESGPPTALNAINAQSGLGVYDTHLARKPASPFEVMQGSVIPATLTTGIESDLPGQITAVVSRNVFDSASGANLLIPAGAQIVGTYASRVLPGQSSVAVAWTRILFPNGSYISLGAMPGTDPNGMSGISGDVDNHTWLMFKNALLLSLVGTGIQAATPQTTSATGSMNTTQIFQSQLASTFGQAVSQILQRYMNIAPTIHVQPGVQLAVVVSKDLVFPGPYTARMQAQSQPVRDTATPAMVNPYPKFAQ